MSGIEIAKKMVGLQEVRDRRALMEYFKKWSYRGDLIADPSKTPWCAYIMNAWERNAGFKGTGSGLARSFDNYGIEVDQEDAREGDIIRFRRTNDPNLGHVAYFVKWEDDKDAVLILGGNQVDKVCYQSRTQEGIVAIRRSQK